MQTPLALKKVSVCSGSAKNKEVFADLVNQYPISGQMNVPSIFEDA